MAGVRLNSEKKIDVDNFKIKIGTTNKINPEVVYVEGRTFVSPLSEHDNHMKDMTDIKHRLKNIITTNLQESNIFETKFILDFQVASSGVKVGKKSFLSFQIILKQKQPIINRLLDIKKQSEHTIVSIVNGLTSEIESMDYTIAKSKK